MSHTSVLLSNNLVPWLHEATSPSVALLHGRSGVGKEKIANELNRVSYKQKATLYHMRDLNSLNDLLAKISETETASIIYTELPLQQLQSLEHFHHGSTKTVHITPLVACEHAGTTFRERLSQSDIPAIAYNDSDSSDDLAKIYLQEFLGDEAAQFFQVRNLRAFAKFLRTIASDSLKELNLGTFAKRIGIPRQNATSYLEILTLSGILIPVEQYILSTNIINDRSIYLFFDLLIREACFEIHGRSIEDAQEADEEKKLFSDSETIIHYVGIELWKRIQRLKNTNEDIELLALNDEGQLAGWLVRIEDTSRALLFETKQTMNAEKIEINNQAITTKSIKFVEDWQDSQSFYSAINNNIDWTVVRD